MISYEFDEARSLAHITLSGELGDEEAIAWFAGFLADMAKFSHVRGIVDARPLSGLDMSSQGVQRMARAAAEYDATLAGSRWAIVASQDVVFGMARMYEMLRGDAPYQIGVFRSMEEALRFMELPASDGPA